MRAEILTLINSKTVRFDGAGSGLPLLTADDINAAVSYCNPVGLNMLLNRVCGVESASKAAHKHLTVAIETLAKHWRVNDREKRLPLLSLLAIYETNSTPVCPACKGRKFNRFHKPCRPCKATGKFIIRDSHRARALDISHSTYTRVWSHRYNEVLQLISDKESQALREISRRIGRH